MKRVAILITGCQQLRIMIFSFTHLNKCWSKRVPLGQTKPAPWGPSLPSLHTRYACVQILECSSLSTFKQCHISICEYWALKHYRPVDIGRLDCCARCAHYASCDKICGPCGPLRLYEAEIVFLFLTDLMSMQQHIASCQFILPCSFDLNVTQIRLNLFLWQY